jgi:alkyl sulfatase BDS1-like metallo-beta-lactamase superfamily hydrolase
VGPAIMAIAAICIVPHASAQTQSAGAVAKEAFIYGDPIVAGAAEELKHPDPKGSQPPSPYTIEVQQRARATMPFDDRQDFAEAKKGFIAAPMYRKIMQDAGGVAWDMDEWDFLLERRSFDSVHPSLQRQALLNMEFGLYEVTPGLYQVRGFDLANISFIRGTTGWIVMDPLTVKETARAALDFVNEKLGKRPVVAVIISHSHVDHFGGVRGVVSAEDAASGKVPIIAPAGFIEESISENLFAGNAMVRRKSYTYGDATPPGPFGQVDCSIGKNVAKGATGILPPTKLIAQPYEELTVDGVRIVFQSTPGTEAPVEMNAWFPDFKAFWAAENMVGTLHNLYTLRGAKTRDPRAWAHYINEALYRFGPEAEVMFTSHNWPRWGNARVQEVMRDQRDMYANLNNQVLHLANQGVTISQIHNVYAPPKSLQQKWYTHGYHGSYEHNSRAVINYYLGYWDANPATLVPLSPEASAPLYVEMMGGAGKILAKGEELIAQGKYRHAMEILNKLVQAEPHNQIGKDLLADAFEQLGYQSESPSLRNSYLSAAKELRDGIQPRGALPQKAADVIRGTPTGLLLDALAIQVDSRKAEGMKFKLNLVYPDNGERFVVEMSNATLTHIAGYQAKDADLTITLNRSDLEEIMLGKAKLAELARAGKARLDGNPAVLQQLAAACDKFDPMFQIMPGTRASAEPPKAKDEVFEHEIPPVHVP